MTRQHFLKHFHVCRKSLEFSKISANVPRLCAVAAPYRFVVKIWNYPFSTFRLRKIKPAIAQNRCYRKSLLLASTLSSNSGRQNPFCGYYISFCGNDKSNCGSNKSNCGMNISNCGNNKSFCGRNNSNSVSNKRNCKSNISDCGSNKTNCGSNYSFCGAVIFWLS